MSATYLAAEKLLCECFGGKVGTLSAEAIPFRDALGAALTNPNTTSWLPLVPHEQNKALLHRLAVFLCSRAEATQAHAGRVLLQMLGNAHYLPALYARAQLLLHKPSASSDVATAIHLLEMAMSEGSVEAAVLLSTCYANGTGVEKSTQKAVALLQKVEAHPEAQFRLGCCFLSGEPEQSYEKGIQLLHSASANGHTDASFELGNVLYTISTSPKEEWDTSLLAAVRAVGHSFAHLWKKAAEASHTVAQFNLACCYRNGTGVEKDEAAALAWAQRAAQRGYHRAQYYLGHTLLKAKKDPSAIQWLLLAAEGGLSEAQLLLSQCFRTGTGTVKDMPLALQYLIAAADRGHPEAQHQVAVEYFAGASVPRSVEKGMVWLERAADSGSKRSNRMISQCYYTGTFLPKDDKKAFEHALFSAEAHDKMGMHNVAYCYAHGIGVVKSEETANEWARKAAAPFATTMFIVADCHLVQKGWAGEAPALDAMLLTSSYEAVPATGTVL